MTTPATSAPVALGDYDVVAPIGRGGMADVLAARLRAQPDRLVALKVIRPELAREPGFVAMFIDEARIASRLSHPNIVAMYGLGHHAGRHYLAMELLRGRTLQETCAAVQAKRRILPFALAAWIGARVADALHHAHELRDETGSPALVVHRDVNPSNIFLCGSGEPKVIDFGLAKARDRIGGTAIGVVKGKLAYLSPEQVAGKPVDRRSDIFSLGITLWEITVGRRLFREDSDVATVRRVLAADVPDPTTLVTDYPPALAAVLRRALDPDPMTRFASGSELARELDAFVEGAGGCSAHDVAALLTELFPPGSAPAWEAIVFPEETGAAREGTERGSLESPGQVRVWDDDAQKMTWMAASAETMARDISAPTVAMGLSRSRAQEIDQALVARASKLTSDRATLARVHLERSLVDELLGDGASAAAHARESLDVMDSPAAHATLRRLLHARGAARALLAHEEAELAATVGDAARADRWAERGRLLRAAGEDRAEAIAAFEHALACAPGHAAALKGLEEELERSSGEGRDARLAGHLARMADAYAEDAALAAQLHVERAELLDATDVNAAREALNRALALDPKGDVVREACVTHASRHREWAWLAELLDAEAAMVSTQESTARAAALELEAACIQRRVLGRDDRAIALLERAAARAPTTRRIDARVADELVLLHERAGVPGSQEAERVLRARRRRLAYVANGAARATELRAIAAIQESRGDDGAAIAALREARAADGADASAAVALDRLLAAASLTGERIALLVEEASRATDTETSARFLLRASALAETQGDVARAIELARACLVAKPADLAAVDALSRLLASRPTEAQVAEARARIAVHAHAAEHATDEARRVAHLEAVALLSEEMLGDPALAATEYERILALDPQRRGALLGLARTARRAGDGARHVRALLDEAALIAEPRAADALRLQAADVLAASADPGDWDRALGLTGDMLLRDPANAPARQIEQRIHERAGRWGLVDAGIVARIERADGDGEKATLLAQRGELLRMRLRDPVEALRAFRHASALAPGDEELPRTIVSMLEAQDDARLLKEGLVDRAGGAPSPAAAADALARAAELDELVLGDEGSACALMDRAIALAPEDAALAERRARIQRRRAGRAPMPSAEESARAFAADPRAPHALRALEAAARREGSAPLLASALSGQAEVWRAPAARLGALFGLLDLVEWTLPEGDPAPVLDAILAIAPDDVAALDARIRCTLRALAARDEGGHARLDSLRRRVGSGSDRGERILARLALGLALDPDSGADDASLREALGWYAAVLAEDPGSIVAAHGAVRLGARFNDERAFIAGTTALADVAAPAERAVRLTQAAGRLLATRSAHLGAPADRLERAFDWLEAALDANPDAVLAAALLIGARTEETHRDRVTVVLRRALERATTTDAKVQHGVELARIARLDPPDRVLAIDALRRVVAAAPENAPAWRALADVALEQGAPAEAEAALESMVRHIRDPRMRLAAFFDLAEIYRRRPDRAGDVERVLRAALDADPTNERAVRELLAARRVQAPREEITALLARLADAAHGAEAKATVFGELAEAYVAAGDASAAEGALVEALALAPSTARLGRLLELHASNAVEQARVLGAAVARGEALGRADPATLARLGRLEIEALDRPADGVAHLRGALALSPTMHDVRATIARGLVDAGSAAEAISTIASMMIPDASPLLSLADPAAGLATLDRAFEAERQPDEALVARELRVIGGGLDDGAHVELRARRQAPGTLERCAGALDRATLLSAVAPPEIVSIALSLAHALEGVETKLARTDLEALEITPRARLAATDDGPLNTTYLALSAALGIEPSPFALSDRVGAPRIALVDGATWVVAPFALASRPHPEQLTALTRPLVRVALGVPWIDEIAGLDLHALLIAAARRAMRSYAQNLEEPGLEERVQEMSKRVARLLGPLAFKQKKALSDLAERLAERPPLDARGVYVFALAVARTELRTAFLLSGDLLATLDAIRATEPAFARETDRVGPRALAGTLGHPVGADLVRFALSRRTTALRRRLGTSWHGPSDSANG